MANLFDALEGLSRGVSDSDKNLGTFLKLGEDKEDRELDRLLKEAKLGEILQKRASLEDALIENEKKTENLRRYKLLCTHFLSKIISAKPFGIFC